jgi:short-subunit dehydrogenase
MPSYNKALVTGASSGVGEAFAALLAAEGCDLVLVARKADQLADLAERLRDRHGVAVDVLQADLTLPDQIGAVEQRLAEEGRPIDLLVNSAGVLGRIGGLADQPVDAELHKIDLNATAAVRLTRAVLPGMLERGHGSIINVSSVMAFVPTPHAVTYSATKAFLVSFSESLHGETRRRGVNVTALCPGSVRTRLHDGDSGRPRARTAARFGVLEPETVARAGLDAARAGRPIVVPGRRWTIVVGLSRLLPRALVRKAFYKLWGR